MKDLMKNKKEINAANENDVEIYDDNGTPTEETSAPKRKRRVKTGCLIVLIAALVLVGGAVVSLMRYRSTISAVLYGLTHTSDSIAADLEKAKTDTATALTESGISVSAEDLERAESGEMTEEEITQMIYDAITADAQNTSSETPDGTPVDETVTEDGQADKTTADKADTTVAIGPEAAGNPAGSGTVSDKPHSATNTSKPVKMSSEEVDRRVAELIAQVYVLKSKFTGMLSSFEAGVIAQYKALPPEQRGAAAKAKIVSDNMGYVAGLEAQCDAQMASITSELTTLLKENGRDTSIVDAIKSAYAGEKEMKKSYYISLYK